MSTYTTQVRYICESLAGLDASVGYNSVKDVLDKSWDKIFDFEFPIFDEAYRKQLCCKILKHYYTREIGLGTFGGWQLKLDTKMNEIMPYYNQLYKSELLEYDPLIDTDIMTIYGENGDDKINTTETNNANSNVNANETNINMYSDTPQGSLRNVETGEYLTNASKNESTAKTSTNVSGNANKDETKQYNKDSTTTVKGKTGSKSYGELLKEFRANMLNIDMQVIDSLSELFFNLW